MIKSRGIPTKFLIISDTHLNHPISLGESSDTDSIRRTHGFRHPLPQADVLLHCGDFTVDGGMSAHLSAIDFLRSVREIPIKLVIPGNHELDLDPRLVKTDEQKRCFEETKALWKEQEKVGIRLLEEGRHQIVLHNGAILRLFVSPWTPKFGEWAFQYDPDIDRYNSKESGVDADSLSEKDTSGTDSGPEEASENDTSNSIIPKDVDVVMTHGPPKFILDGPNPRYHPKIPAYNAGCVHLGKAIGRTKPMLHCFGHCHEAWGVARGTYRGSAGMISSKWEEGEDGATLPYAFRAEQNAVIDRDEARSAGVAMIDATSMKKGEQTIFINAAIAGENLGIGGRATNAPWLVTLSLNAAGTSG